MLLAVQPPVVVGDGVEVEVLDQPVESDRHLRSPGEVVLVDALVEREQCAGELQAVGELGVCHFLDTHTEVVELEHLHVGAELGGDQRHVGRDVEHPGIQMAEKTVAPVPETAAHRCGVHPLLDAPPGALLAQVPRHRPELDARAAEDVAHLGDGALTAVGEPLAGAEVGVVHLLARLKVDDQHRRVSTLGDRQHHRSREVGGQEDDDEVAVGEAELLRRGRRLDRVGDEADVDHVGVEPLESFGDVGRRLLQLGKEARELRPVGRQPTGHEPDAGAAALERGEQLVEVRGGAPGNSHGRSLVACGRGLGVAAVLRLTGPGAPGPVSRDDQKS